MAQKTAQVDKLITNVSKGYVPPGYISESILTKLKVKQSSGLIGQYGEDHLRVVNTVMGGRGMAPRYESITRSSQTYLIENHGLEGLVTKDDFANVEQPFDARKDEALGLSTIIRLGREKALADSLSSTSVLTNNTTLAGTDQWNDYSLSDPIADIKLARITIFNAVGAAPDTVILGWDVAETLKYHPVVLQNLGFTQNRAGTLTEIEMARVFGVRRVLIGEAQFNSAKKGQTDVRANVWGKIAVMAVSPQSASKFQTALGYTVRKTSESPNQTFRFNVNNPPGAEGIIVQDNYDDVLTNVKCGYLIKNAIA